MFVRKEYKLGAKDSQTFVSEIFNQYLNNRANMYLYIINIKNMKDVQMRREIEKMLFLPLVCLNRQREHCRPPACSPR